jgi:Carboxypeptidase regulatory-like domain/TonB dependent receptor
MEASLVISPMRKAVPIFLSALCALLLAMPTSLLGQVSTADIVGTATDPNGAAVADGTATATNLATGVSQRVALSKTGDFTFTLLQTGSYSVTVQAPGFKEYETQVTLAVGDRARVSAQLTLGQASETVTVQSITPALQTDDSTIGTLITSQATQDLPLNGRNVTDLITLSAGVTGGLSNALSSGTRPDDRRLSSTFTANGQSDQLNNNMIDGMDNNERFIGSVGVRPSIDAIEEVRVFTNLYTAEISRSQGGVVDLITKSGGNQFHGTAYEFVRNDKFDARNYFSTTGPKPELRQNQFGGSIGGPIKKDKAFFFFDYENFRQVSGITATSTVPTLFEEQNPGNFSDLGLGCVNLTSRAGFTPDPIGLNYFKLYPAPNNAVSVPGNCAAPANNFTYTSGLTRFLTTYDAKVDYRFSPSDSAYARYTYNDANVYEPAPLPVTTVAGIKVNPGAGPYGANFAGPAIDQEQSAAIGYTHVFNTKLILELQAQYMRLDNQSDPVNVGKEVATAFGFPGGSSAYAVNLPGDPVSSGLPNISSNVQGYAQLGDADYVPLHDQNNSFQYMGSVSWLRGDHSIKFGAGVIRRQGTQAQSSHPRGNATISSTDPALPGAGNDLAVLLSGLATSVTRGYTIQTPTWRGWEPSAYVQDNWHALPKLTLNLGLRYDVYTPFTAANDAFDNFNSSTGLLYGPGLPGGQRSNATGGVNTDYGNVAPRLGFAYEAKPGLVVRGGYGITFMSGNSLLSGGFSNAPYTFNISCGDTAAPINSIIPCPAPLGGTNGAWYLDGGLPVPTADLALVTNPSNYANEGTLYTYDFNLKSSYLQQWSLNVQKEFFHGTVATVAYVGNKGSRLPTLASINQLPYAGAPYPIPSLPGVTIADRESIMSSNYNALQASLQRRLENGLAFNVNYTWAHALTNVGGIGEGNAQGSCVGPCHVDNGSGQAVVYDSFFQYDYGNSDLDTRQRVSITATYNLPFGHSLTGPAAYAVKGWSLNSIYYAQTGIPITIASSTNTSGLPVTERPNQVKPAPGFHKSLAEWYDVSQFRLPGVDLLGNAQRNSIFGPGTQALGFSVFKYIPIRERLNLQFRAEAFNLFNTPTFSQPGATVSFDANGVGQLGNGAGAISSTTAASAPRQIQLALKLIF